MDPKYIEVWGKFTPRGGISIDPYCNYGRPGTKWEDVPADFECPLCFVGKDQFSKAE